MNKNQEKLAALAAAATRKTEVQALLADTKAAWELARTEEILTETRLESETADVERLDKKSLPNLLLTVTGKMEDRRETEEAEAAEAREAHQAAVAYAGELHAQISALEAELRSLGNCDRDLEALAAAMTAEALAQGGELAARVSEAKARMEKNAAEAEELGELLTVGERLSARIQSVAPALHKARRSYDRRYDSPTARHGGGLILSEASLNADLDEGERDLPMLVALAESFRSDLIDLPPVGSLTTLQNIFKGTYTGSTADHLDNAISELEALERTVARSMDKIRRVTEKRREAKDRAREEWIGLLMNP